MKNIRAHKPKKGPRSNNPDSAGAFGNVIMFNTNKPKAIKLPDHPNNLLKLRLLAMFNP